MATGASILLVIGESEDESHTCLILERIKDGFSLWDGEKCSADLNTELLNFVNSDVDPEETDGNGLVLRCDGRIYIEALIEPSVALLNQALQNFLLIPSAYKLILHAGPIYQGTGSWILRDGTFSFHDFARFLYRGEMCHVFNNNNDTHGQEAFINVSCILEGEWSELGLKTHDLTKRFGVSVRARGTHPPPACLNDFGAYVRRHLDRRTLSELTPTSTMVGSLKFRRPTAYLFAGGQGDALLFGVNGFLTLVDGGAQRQPCFWPFLSHVDRLDAHILTGGAPSRGAYAFMQRMADGFTTSDEQGAEFSPKLGFCMANVPAKPPTSQQRNSLIISAVERERQYADNTRKLGLEPQPLHGSINPTTKQPEPQTLYQKVGVGRLDMYVLSPMKDSKELADFCNNWKKLCVQQQNLAGPSFSLKPGSHDHYPLPLKNQCAAALLLVWEPAQPHSPVVRLLYPGDCPQDKVLQGLDRLKHLEFLRHRQCTPSSLAAASTTAPSKKSSSVIGQTGHFSGRKSLDVSSVKTKPLPTVLSKIQNGTRENGSSSPAPFSNPPISGWGQSPVENFENQQINRQKSYVSGDISLNDYQISAGDILHGFDVKTAGNFDVKMEGEKIDEILPARGFADSTVAQLENPRHTVTACSMTPFDTSHSSAVEKNREIPSTTNEHEARADFIQSTIAPMTLSPMQTANLIDAVTVPQAVLKSFATQEKESVVVVEESTAKSFFAFRDETAKHREIPSPTDDNASPSSPSANLNPDAPIFVPRRLSANCSSPSNENVHAANFERMPSDPDVPSFVPTSIFKTVDALSPQYFSADKSSLPIPETVADPSPKTAGVPQPSPSKNVEELKEEWGSPLGLPPVREQPPVVAALKTKPATASSGGKNGAAKNANATDVKAEVTSKKDEPATYAFKARPAPKLTTGRLTTAAKPTDLYAAADGRTVATKTGHATATKTKIELTVVTKTTVAPSTAKTTTSKASTSTKSATSSKSLSLGSSTVPTNKVEQKLQASKVAPSAKNESMPVKKSAVQKTAVLSAKSSTGHSSSVGKKPPTTAAASPGAAYYVDLAFLPRQGNPHYCNAEQFFRLVRARYYALTAPQLTKESLDAALLAKRHWNATATAVSALAPSSPSNQPATPTAPTMTLVPAYDGEALLTWMSLRRDEIAREGIEVAPSCARCTLNLEQEGGGAVGAAYRLEL